MVSFPKPARTALREKGNVFPFPFNCSSATRCKEQTNSSQAIFAVPEHFCQQPLPYAEKCSVFFTGLVMLHVPGTLW